MKKMLALFALCASCYAYAQTTFEKGFFITTDGTKVECLIKNEDWIGVPSKIEYKTNQNAETNTVTEKSLSKVFIENRLLLERHLVSIERYSKDLSELSKNRIINSKEESLLLKVIADGKARLLRYDFDGVQYFYFMLNGTIQPLEYKLYKTSRGTLGKNLNYQKTLREKLSCSNNNSTSKIKYKEKALVKYITNYNSCHNSSTKVFSQETQKGKFNIRAKLSFGQSKTEDNDYLFAYKIGGEVEYVLPFNNFKWSVFIEPTYQNFSQSGRFIIGKREAVVSLNGDRDFVPVYFEGKASYKSIEIPFGIRHYLFTDSKNTFFANGGFIVDLVLNENFISEPNESFPLSSGVNYFLGFGYQINKKYSIEFRYNTPRRLRLEEQNGYMYSDFSNYSVKLGYNFL